MRAGDRFTFRAVVLDADGCPTGTRPAWTIAPGPLAAKAGVDASGTLTIAADAGEGKLELSVAVGGKGVTVAVDVASPEHYDALLGASGLNDAGEAEKDAVAVIAAGTIGGRTTVGEDLAKERKIRFVALVGGLAALLAFAGLVVARRGRRRVGEVGDVGDVEPDAGIEDEAAPPPEPAAKAPPPEPPEKAPPRRARKGKICPTCGERYESEATFCGKDGTELVPVNG
jgi:hypothetical protein